MMKIYIVGDIGNIHSVSESISFHDADTHEKLALSQAQITLFLDQPPSIDFRRTVLGAASREKASLERAELVACPEIPSAKPQVEVDEDVSCKHTGWVSHDVQGDNRFWCRECDERFINHPLVVKKTLPPSGILCSSCGHRYQGYCPRCHIVQYKSSSKNKSKPHA